MDAKSIRLRRETGIFGRIYSQIQKDADNGYKYSEIVVPLDMLQKVIKALEERGFEVAKGSLSTNEEQILVVRFYNTTLQTEKT